jgi:hypothetical protein
MTISRSGFVKAAAAAGLVLAALGSASVAEARSNVFFSIGANVAPGVTVGVGNGFYPAPVYVQPSPVYYQPAPVYYQPAPVYYQPQPVYYEPQPVYYAPAVYVAPPVYRVGYGWPYYHRHHHDRYDR